MLLASLQKPRWEPRFPSFNSVPVVQKALPDCLLHFGPHEGKCFMVLSWSSNFSGGVAGSWEYGVEGSKTSRVHQLISHLRLQTVLCALVTKELGEICQQTCPHNSEAVPGMERWLWMWNNVSLWDQYLDISKAREKKVCIIRLPGLFCTG